MLARDLMSTGLLTFLPDMGLEAAARAMAERGVSGAPVVRDDGQLVGIITEGDLIKRLSAPSAPEAGWFASLFRAPESEAARFARVHGRTVKDAMAMDVASVNEDATAEQPKSWSRAGCAACPCSATVSWSGSSLAPTFCVPSSLAKVEPPVPDRMLRSGVRFPPRCMRSPGLTGT
jgi:hypothetical protein